MSSAPETRVARPSLRSVGVAAGLAVSLFFTWIALRQVELDAFGRALATSDYGWLVPASAALAVAVVVRVERWRLVFAPDSRPGRAATRDALFIGLLFNSILPVRAGEAARVVALQQRAGTPWAEGGATALTERIHDLLALCLLLVVARPFLPDATWLDAAARLALGLSLGIVALAVVVARYGERPLRRLLRPVARLPRVPSATVDRLADSLLRGLAGLRWAGLAARAFAATVLSWLLLSLSAWLLMAGFDLGLGFGAALLVVVATNLAMVLPSSPAAVGVYEAAVLLALSPYGIEESRALSYAVVLHALNVLPFVALGWLVLHRHARRVRRPATVPPT
jgi:uncharacterized protein (TIRG00374 family)